MKSLIRKLMLLPAATVLLSACAPDAPEPADDSTAGAAEEASDAMPRTAAPADARVYFLTPADGVTVSNPIRIEFGIEGMSVAKAGVDQPGTGHHHLIIDADLPDLSMPIPASEHYVHFGDGSTSTEITLEPGSHTLRLLLGDHLHVPHDPPVMSEPITITVSDR